MSVRVPFIPGFNSSDEDMEGICRLIAGTGAGHADILPFHRLAVSKYEALGLEYVYRDTKPPEKDEINRAAEILGRYLDVSCEQA